MKRIKIALAWCLRPKGPTDTGGKDLAPPVWAIALSAYLKEKIPTAEIRILDSQLLSVVAMRAALKNFKPDYLGISISYRYYGECLALARLAKLLGAKVVFGGAYATVLGKEILPNRGVYSNDYCVDVIIKGDGEESFYEYISGRPLSKIKNLMYQGKNGIEENPIKTLNVDGLPFFDATGVAIDEYFKYQNPEDRHLVICVHRGCQWRAETGGCFFCSCTDRNFRPRNPKLVVQEMEQLIRKYKISCVRIYDEDFLSDNAWFEEFARLYLLRLKRMAANNLPALFIFSRADGVNSHSASLLKKINVDKIFIGFESGDENCLRSVSKGTSLSILKGAAYLLNKNKIKIIGSFIYGLPGESKSTLIKTLKFMEELASLEYFFDFQLRRFIPLPGSPAWQILMKKVGLAPEYHGQDNIDYNKVCEDWMKYFCDLNAEDINDMEAKFKLLSKKYGHVKFSLMDEFM